MKKIIYITTMLSVLLFTACSSVSEEDLIEPIITGEKVIYSDIEPTIQTNCTSCHNNPPQFGAPMPLLTYDNVKEAVENRNLIGRISSDEPGFSMPFGGPKLPQNIIDVITQWQADGLLEEAE